MVKDMRFIGFVQKPDATRLKTRQGYEDFPDTENYIDIPTEQLPPPEKTVIMGFPDSKIAHSSNDSKINLPKEKTPSPQVSRGSDYIPKANPPKTDAVPNKISDTARAPSATPLAEKAPIIKKEETSEQENEELKEERLEFVGTGGEYFRIWTVNVFLTVLTLGVYSAWAKVRKMRYFYDSTKLAGSSFEYHAKPLPILKGRFIILLLFIGIPKLLEYISPTLAYAATLITYIVLPWLLWKSIRFKLFNSSYRGIRFGFNGSQRDSYKVYLFYPFLGSIVGGLIVFVGFMFNFPPLVFVGFMLIIPLLYKEIKRFQAEGAYFGNVNFSFFATTKDFYKTIFIPLFFGGIVFFCASFLFGLFIVGKLTQGTFIVFMAVNFLIMLSVYQWVFAMVHNLVWNNITLGQYQFRSEMTHGKTFYIIFTNLLLTILTFGLYAPYGKVRMLKYQTESLYVSYIGSDEFTPNDSEEDERSAIGDSAGDLMDFDIGL